MISQRQLFDTLLFLAIVSFGFFGSLSHLFTLGLLVTFALNSNFSTQKKKFSNAKIFLFLLLTSFFFLFFVRGLFSSNFTDLIKSLSPMLAIPILGLLILLQPRYGLTASYKQSAKYSQCSIVFVLCLYFLFWNIPEDLIPILDLKKNLHRLELLSGNPVPFSTVIFGTSLLCLANWNKLNFFQKIPTLICFLIGVYIATILSGTRGTLLALFISVPFLMWYLLQWKVIHIIYLNLIIIASLILMILYKPSFFSHAGIEFSSDSLELYISQLLADNYINTRLELWTAAIKAISESLLVGYGIAERFSILETFLPHNFSKTFTHPHNDILASFIGAGFIGGLLAFIALLSVLWATLILSNRSHEGLFLGFTLSISIFLTANFNTMFFNDICAAWLGFLTFLMFNLSINSQED